MSKPRYQGTLSGFPVAGSAYPWDGSWRDASWTGDEALESLKGHYQTFTWVQVATRAPLKGSQGSFKGANKSPAT